MTSRFWSRCLTCFGVGLLFLLLSSRSGAQDPVSEGSPEWLPQATELLRQGKADEALEGLDAVPAADRDTRYANLKGAIYTQIRRFVEARTMFTEAIKLAGDTVP